MSAAAQCQPAILESPPPLARCWRFGVRAGVASRAGMRGVAGVGHDPKTVVGVGVPLGPSIPGLRAFPADLAPFPSTQQALWVWLAHGEPGRMFDAGRAFAARFRG